MLPLRTIGKSCARRAIATLAVTVPMSNGIPRIGAVISPAGTKLHMGVAEISSSALLHNLNGTVASIRLVPGTPFATAHVVPSFLFDYLSSRASDRAYSLFAYQMDLPTGTFVAPVSVTHVRFSASLP